MARKRGPSTPKPKKRIAEVKKTGGEWTDERRDAIGRVLVKHSATAAAARMKTHDARQLFPAFAEKALTIRRKDGTLGTLKLNLVQHILHQMAESQLTQTGRVRLLVLKARQPGVSTYVEGRFFWKTVTGQGQRAFILTHEEPASNNLFEMAKRFYEHSPDASRPKLAAANARELKFAGRDCSYRVGTAGTEGIGRSETIQLFHGSEVAHWPNAESHAAGVLQAVPNAKGTEIWLESTAAGPAGLFYTMAANSQPARTSRHSTVW